MARSSNSAFAIFAALCIALFLVAQLASAAPLAKRQPGGGGRGGGGHGGPMGAPPDGGNGNGNGTRPDFNGTHGGPGGPGGPRGPRFGVPVDRLLSSVSAACSTAANSTSGFDVCRPDNSTIGSNSTKDAGKEAECSTACSDAVKSYYTALKTACGSEPLITETPRNASAFNLTATDLEGAALLELALGCSKDLSGNYCGGGPRGGRGGPGGHQGGPGGDRPPMNGTDAPTGTDAPAQPTQALRKRQPPSDAGMAPPQFNSTICAECTQSQLSAVSTLESERPTQTYFGRRPEVTSWALLKEDISGRCDKIASMIASATAMPTGTAPPAAQATQAA